jgi:hypothetical protein
MGWGVTFIAPDGANANRCQNALSGEWFVVANLKRDALADFMAQTIK